MKKIIVLIVILLIGASIGFAWYKISKPTVEETPTESEEIAEKEKFQKKDKLPKAEEEEEIIIEDDEPQTYTIFSMNVHDWVFVENSIETLHKVIDIHEKYQVPVDIYLTDPTYQLYLELDESLMDRFKTSEMVAISYHVRPPAIFYPDFKEELVENLSDEEKYDLILDHEENRLDLVTGEPTDEPGGYQYLKELMGYPPLTVGLISGKLIGDAASQVYTEKGAIFAVVHGRESILGDMSNGLYKRPENIEIKLYEYATMGNTESAEEIIAERLDEYTGTGDIYIGLKYHENNFYTIGGTPWWPVFFEDSSKTIDKDPPYDLTAYEGLTSVGPIIKQDTHWALYEETVAYIAENRDTFNPINMFDVAEMLEDIK